MSDSMIVADSEGKHIIHLGDFIFLKNNQVIPPFFHPENHLLIMGNHDDDNMDYSMWFGTVVGSKKTWREHFIKMHFGGRRIVLSHNPLSTFKGDLNFHGHVHNHPYLQPALERSTFLFLNSKYRNVCVEQTNYKVATFSDVLNIPIPTGF
jgi:calcineurin-like phosphoesterase family protein